MAKRVHNIHDKFVKASFSNAERAASFFEKNLPANLLNDIDLSTLNSSQESYIQGNLNEHFSDMVFDVKYKNNESIDLVLLFEHKSSPDKYVLIQVGHYIFSHWFKCVNERKELKLIIPLIYYQGQKKWKAPELFELFPKLTNTLFGYIPVVKHIFLALNTLSDEDIKQIQDKLMAAAILAQKKGVNLIKLVEDIIKIFELFPNSGQDGNFLEQIFVYVLSVADVTKPELSKAIEFIPTNLKNDIMTTYTRIKEEGKIEGKTEIILSLYGDGFNLEHIAKLSKMTQAEVQQIIHDHHKTN